jgi:hypothetical protein
MNQPKFTGRESKNRELTDPAHQAQTRRRLLQNRRERRLAIARMIN